MYPPFIVSMLRLTTACLYVLVGAQLHVSRALTTTTFLAKHVNNPTAVAHPRTQPATSPGTRTPWLPGGGTASSGERAVGFNRAPDSRRRVNFRERPRDRLLSMTASPVTAQNRPSPVGGGSAATSVNWPLWYVLPIAPYQRRKTLMEEIVPGKVRFYIKRLLSII